MKVWIDLANSPHPLLFAPIARGLEAAGATVAVTIRDHAQTRELGLERWPEAAVIGGASPGGRLAKPRALARRVRGLIGWARAERPDVALSHNSYAQIVAARRLGIRAVTAMDYEHQPANHLAFRLADVVLLPEAVPQAAVARQGARPAKVMRYPGLKEEVYLSDFKPDPRIRDELGLGPAEPLAVARAAPAGAAYHRGENPAFVAALRALASRPGLRTVVLARHPEQRETVAALGLEGAIVPTAALDARSLLCAAELFVGAGGTMTREAALLGVPTVSIFAGRPAAVDAVLEDRGLLVRVSEPEQVEPALAAAVAGRGGGAGGGPTEAPGAGADESPAAGLGGERIVARFVAATLDDAAVAVGAG